MWPRRVAPAYEWFHVSASDREVCLRHIRSYAAASVRLHLDAWAGGGDGVLRDVQISLCEDLRSVMVMATHRDGSDIYSSFELPTTEEDFDHNFWRLKLPGRVPAADEPPYLAAVLGVDLGECL